MCPNKTQIYRRNTRPVQGMIMSMKCNLDAEKCMCKKEQCQTCICNTCMHQGFDCDCGTENDGVVRSCEDYDEMQGEQLQLNL